jgi:hypothetical protein
VPVTPALGGLRKEDLEFEDSLGYRARCCFRLKRNKKGRKGGGGRKR